MSEKRFLGIKCETYVSETGYLVDYRVISDTAGPGGLKWVDCTILKTVLAIV